MKAIFIAQEIQVHNSWFFEFIFFSKETPNTAFHTIKHETIVNFGFRKKKTIQQKTIPQEILN